MTDPLLPSNPPTSHAVPRTVRSAFVWIAILALALTIVALAWRGWSDLGRTQREFARRIAESETRAGHAVQASQESTNAVIDLRAKIAVLEARLAESQSQQYALEQLYQELSRNRDEVQLADFEQTLSAAAQQLQLLGNVQAAIITLQSIDTRLARVDKPQFLGVRRAIGRDLDRLRALPSADISGMAVKLDQLVAQVDVLPTLIDAGPAPTAAVAVAPVGASAKSAKPGLSKSAPQSTVLGAAGQTPVTLHPGPIEQWWSRTVERFAAEARELVHIRQVGSPDALLLAPNQAYFLRENLKLRLLNARLQLLSRNEAGFRSDLAAASDWVARYFDPQPKTVTTFTQSLKALQTAPVSVDLPALSESLNAVRNFRPGGGVLAPSRSLAAPPASGPTAPPAAVVPGSNAPAPPPPAKR